eukprot:1482527-Rhodomonas_salina.9
MTLLACDEGAMHVTEAVRSNKRVIVVPPSAGPADGSNSRTCKLFEYRKLVPVSVKSRPLRLISNWTAPSASTAGDKHSDCDMVMHFNGVTSEPKRHAAPPTQIKSDPITVTTVLPLSGPSDGWMNCRNGTTVYSYSSAPRVKSTPLIETWTRTTPTSCSGLSHRIAVEETRVPGTTMLSTMHADGSGWLKFPKLNPPIRSCVPPRFDPALGVTLSMYGADMYRNIFRLVE